jgi:hypothetical protein
MARRLGLVDGLCCFPQPHARSLRLIFLPNIELAGRKGMVLVIFSPNGEPLLTEMRQGHRMQHQIVREMEAEQLEPVPATKPGDRVLRRLRKSRGRLQAFFHKISKHPKGVSGKP